MNGQGGQGKLRDLWWMTATLLPVTRCEPPEGQTCPMSVGLTGIDIPAAKRHALENPGHLVSREAVTRTVYHLDPAELAAVADN
jgi:hypothetical protein